MPLKLYRAEKLKGVNVFIQPCLFHDTNHFNAEFVSSTFDKKTVSKQIQSDWFCSFVVNRTLNFLFYVARQNVMFFSGGWIGAFQRSSRSKKFCQSFSVLEVEGDISWWSQW